MDKVEVDYLRFLWPMRHFLVTCGTADRPNIIAVSFCMPVSREPPLLACAIGREMLSCELIGRTGEFVVNVPTADQARQVYYCGSHSGRAVDKFRETGLTPVPARRVGTPAIAECPVHLECRVTSAVEAGEKRLFVATVVDAVADEDVAAGRRRPTWAVGEFPARVYGTRFPGGAPPSRAPGAGR